MRGRKLEAILRRVVTGLEVFAYVKQPPAIHHYSMHDAEGNTIGWNLQLGVYGANTMDPNASYQWWWGREFFVHKDATEQQVINTLLLAVLTYAEHELRERFTYKGKHVFVPTH